MVVIPGPAGALAARITGEGSAALVLLAGGPGMSSDYLAPLGCFGGPGLRVASFDYRGVGRSSWPKSPAEGAPARFGLRDHAADVDALREHLGAPRVHLFAHSWGGCVAWQYLAERPERVASLILAAASAPLEADNRRAQARLFERVAELRRRGFIAGHPPADPERDGTAQLRSTYRAYFHDVMAPLPEALRATELNADARRAVLAEAVPSEYAAAARAFAGPSLVIMGRSDPLGIELAQVSAGSLHDARLVILEQAGHYPWLEPAARPAFETALRDFLAAVG